VIHVPEAYPRIVILAQVIAKELSKEATSVNALIDSLNLMPLPALLVIIHVLIAMEFQKIIV
jgi:hypothetical protein